MLTRHQPQPVPPPHRAFLADRLPPDRLDNTNTQFHSHDSEEDRRLPRGTVSAQGRWEPAGARQVEVGQVEAG